MYMLADFKQATKILNHNYCIQLKKCLNIKNCECKVKGELKRQ